MKITVHEKKNESVTTGSVVWADKALAGEYTWDEAVEAAKNIPGWRLPTLEDFWEGLEALGATYDKNYQYYRDADKFWYALGNKDSFYWTADEYGDSGNRAYAFGVGEKDTSEAFFYDMNKQGKCSVRLVKE